MTLPKAWRKVLKDLITYFREIQASYDHRSKTLLKISNIINNTSAPTIFLQSGGIDDAVQVLRTYHKSSITESNKSKEIENDVILALVGLRSDPKEVQAYLDKEKEVVRLQNELAALQRETEHFKQYGTFHEEVKLEMGRTRVMTLVIAGVLVAGAVIAFFRGTSSSTTRARIWKRPTARSPTGLRPRKGIFPLPARSTRTPSPT